MSSIDVREILRSTEPPEKRPRRGDDHLGGFDEKENGVAEGATPSVDDVLAAIESAEETPPVDEHSVKQLILQLEKRILKNREMRIKYADEPHKFMESEMELNVAIQEMHMIATQPDLYELLVQHGAVESILQLLVHENTDIVAAVVNLLQELTDVETLGESEEGAAALVDALLSGQLIGTLVQSIERMNETVKDESDAVHNALAIVENVLDFRSETADLCVNQGLQTWLLKRIAQKGAFDGNKLYSSELLGMVLLGAESARKSLTEKIDGIDVLLRALASYKRHDPSSQDEREYMENLFDALCAALMFAPNRQKFLDGEGLQLMNLMLRERKQSRESALKVLDYATTGPEGGNNCDKFVEILGLRTLFPLLMRTPAKAKRKDTSPDEHEEHVCAVVSSLLRSCSESNRERVISKFVEQDHAKVDRLVELHFKYSERVRKVQAKQKPALTPAAADQQYVDKLDGGLFTLQLVALVLAEVCINGAHSCRDRASKLLNMKGGSLNQVKDVLIEYMDNLGPEATKEKERANNLIAKLVQ
uniref:Beta-catenin-like protein 1 n=1 Tax=Plectus sambesii TaxID=2011161 RepID=A0A914XS68_9BILA